MMGGIQMKNLAAKLINVMKECSHVMKNGENAYHGYKYATCADVLEKVNTALVKYGICSVAIPELLSVDDVLTVKGNTEKLATVRMDIMLTDKDSGETASITGIGSGQDSGDKAVMKAQTAAIKYAYLLSFAISTGDDPEADMATDEGTPRERVQNTQRPRSTTAARRRTMEPADKMDDHVCSECGAPITEKVMQYSEQRYGRPLCMRCQRNEQGIA